MQTITALVPDGRAVPLRRRPPRHHRRPGAVPGRPRPLRRQAVAASRPGHARCSFSQATLERLGQHAHPGHRGHEVGVARPARHHVEVQVARDARPGGPAEVGPEVDPLGRIGRLRAPTAPPGWWPTARRTRRRSGRPAPRRGGSGSTRRCPLAYGYAFSTAKQRSPRCTIPLSALGGPLIGDAGRTRSRRRSGPLGLGRRHHVLVAPPRPQLLEPAHDPGRPPRGWGPPRGPRPRG